MSSNKKYAGLSYKACYKDFYKPSLEISWLEVISENFVGIKGERLESILKLRDEFEFSVHGVSLNLASEDRPNQKYLKGLKELIETLEPVRVSDHLCWTGSDGHNFHDLLPFPYTQKMFEHVSDKVKYIQDILQREILIENLSAYLSFNDKEMSEYEFMERLCKKTGCKILFDINNLYVNSVNFNFDPKKILREIDLSLVEQIHLAGFSEGDDFLIDTHSRPVQEDVWSLYEIFIEKKPDTPYMMEWDSHLPEFQDFYKEIEKANKIREKYV